MTTDAEKDANTKALVSPHGQLASVEDFSSGRSKSTSRVLQQLADTPDERERQIQRTLSNIHAVARHLFGLGPDSRDADDLYVGVQPLGNAWRVQVTYASFELRVKEHTLTDALEQTLAKLMDPVLKRLDEGTRLVAVLDPNFGRVATHDALASAVKRVAGVSEAAFREEAEPGVVTVCVTPDRPMTTEERVQFVAEIGMALGKTGAAVVRFRVQVLDYFNQST